MDSCWTVTRSQTGLAGKDSSPRNPGGAQKVQRPGKSNSVVRRI